MDTARIQVKGGDGGRSACLSTAMHVVEEEELILTSSSTSRRNRNSPVEEHKKNKTSNKRRGRGKTRWKQNDKKDQTIKPRCSRGGSPIQSSSPTTILGGKGGNGGSVHLVCNERLESLVSLLGHVRFEAPNGEDGSMGNRDGANGGDIHIQVPSGTTVRDLYSQNLVGELVEDGDSILLAHGGNGGSKLKRQKQQHDLDSSKGDKRWLTLEYQISADVGIVGMANSGKSSLLAALTNAKPRIDAYPFTTMCPNLGVCQNRSGSRNSHSKSSSSNRSFTLCDLPGLINGASEGAGMGGAFLRHTKNCSVLLHVVDASAENPLADFETVNRELAAFDAKSNSNGYGNFLQDKPQIVVLSKCDMIPAKYKDSLVKEFQLVQKVENPRVLPITVSNVENLDQLIEELYSLIEKT